jgi:voltage-gated sodium channel
MLKLLQEVNSQTAPQLTKIIAAFAAAISSLKYVGALWFIVAYVYAIVGVSQFRGNDPVHFNTLHNAMFTLFGAATFDSLTDLVFTNIHGCDVYSNFNKVMIGIECQPKASGWFAWFYFVTYTVFAAFVLLSIFLGVIQIAMDVADQNLTR